MLGKFSLNDIFVTEMRHGSTHFTVHKPESKYITPYLKRFTSFDLRLKGNASMFVHIHLDAASLLIAMFLMASIAVTLKCLSRFRKLYCVALERVHILKCLIFLLIKWYN